MLQKTYRSILWVLTLVLVVLVLAQDWSGNWAIFYVLWPGGTVGNTIALFSANLAEYHIKMGFVIGVISILIIVLAFLAKSNLYVRLMAILGLVVSVLAVAGGWVYVNSGLADRLSLGQMADASLGVLAFYFLLLFFLNKTPIFPWSKAKTH